MSKYLLLVTITTVAFAQSPKFEVASIKPVTLGQPTHTGITLTDARVDIGYWSLRQLILRAYNLPSYQLSGPDWLDDVRFDVSAKLPDGSKKDQLPEMLQSFLKERFGLVAHNESRTVSGFVLVTGKDGPKLKPADRAADGAEANYRGQTLDSLWSDGKPFGLTTMNAASGGLHMEFKRLPMDGLAQLLASRLGTPVIDSTGLKGEYQATLDWAFGGAPNTASEPVATSVSAEVERLGLKLNSEKTSVAVLVVDHIDRVQPQTNPPWCRLSSLCHDV